MGFVGSHFCGDSNRQLDQLRDHQETTALQMTELKDELESSGLRWMRHASRLGRNWWQEALEAVSQWLETALERLSPNESEPNGWELGEKDSPIRQI